MTESQLWQHLRDGTLPAEPVMVSSSKPIVIPADILVVPANVSFRGKVECKQGDLTAFHATVHGMARFEELPKFVNVSASARFREVTVVNCPITTFEAQTTERAKFYEIQNLNLGNITFGGVLTLDKCSLMTFDATIKGDAEFNHVVFPKSGMNPQFGGVVKMWHCDLQEFNRPVDGNLHISYAKLRSMGPQAIIKGNLYLKDIEPGVILNCTVRKTCYLRISEFKTGPDARINRFSLKWPLYF